MNELTVVDKATEWRRMKSLVLDSVSSPITKRVYNMALDEFFSWYAQEPRPGFTKATVSAWRVSLEQRRLGSSSIIIRMSAIRKLAVEASDNGLLAPEIAAGIQRVKSAKSIGVRAGNWLSLKQAQSLLNTPDITTVKGLRDRAIIAVLLGCALRRSEVAALTISHIQQRDGRWCIVDLFGKHGRVRTIPICFHSILIHYNPVRILVAPPRISQAVRKLQIKPVCQMGTSALIPLIGSGLANRACGTRSALSPLGTGGTLAAVGAAGATWGRVARLCSLSRPASPYKLLSTSITFASWRTCDLFEFRVIQERR